MTPLLLAVLLSVTLTFDLAIGKSSSAGHCSVYQGGCTYKITLTRGECMMSDGTPAAPPADDNEGPAPQAQVQLREASDISTKHNFISQIMTSSERVDDQYQFNPDVRLPPATADHAISAERLDALEAKLTKMMEGLSVRSLRHIRQIKNELRHMSESMNELRSVGGGGGEGRGEGQGGGGGKSKRKVSTPPPVSRTCPKEFSSVGTWSSCYRFSTFNSSWHEAREYCSAFGANLVSLETLQESYILDYLIKSNPERKVPRGWWTAGNYIARNRKWMWTSKHHLKTMSFQRWAPGEPDARSTMHCMLLYKHAAYRWHDGMCSDNHHFICEYHI